jgi:hypothetical protein
MACKGTAVPVVSGLSLHYASCVSDAYDVLTVMLMLIEMEVFWDVTPGRLVNNNPNSDGFGR